MSGRGTQCAIRDGVLVVDKPAGPTSHDVVDRVRRACGERRVGHTGTLDPFATGVLPVCIGRATRLVRFLAGGPKVYRASIRLGVSMTTDDAYGEPMERPRAVRLERFEIERACRALTGELMQTPPMFSAKHVGGQRAYALARKGSGVCPTPTPVIINEIEVEDVREETIELRITCSPGTYVRALARDLGLALGTGGHLVALQRLQSGEFTLERAVCWDEIDAAVVDRILPLSSLLAGWPAVVVGEQGVAALRHGRRLTRALILEGFAQATSERLRAVDEKGELLAIVRPIRSELDASEIPWEPSFQPEIVLLAGTRGERR